METTETGTQLRKLLDRVRIEVFPERDGNDLFGDFRLHCGFVRIEVFPERDGNCVHTVSTCYGDRMVSE